MAYFTKKEQLVIISLIIIIILISLLGFARKNFGQSNKEDLNLDEIFHDLQENKEEEKSNGNKTEENGIIMVHISGEVYKPGLVELNLGARVKDAVDLAGGLKKDADLDRINLAKKLEDEDKIYIPKIGEEGTPVDLNFEGPTGSGSSAGKININNASKDELMTLPGIGEVLAGRIIEYRENNPFQHVEDIKNVSGIGEKRFEEIKDLIIIR